MNRLLHRQSGVIDIATVDHWIEKTARGCAGRSSREYTLLAPHHYERGYGYPLLVWLHGPGDDERQMLRVLPHVSLRNYIAVGPRGCCAPDEGALGFRWRQGAGAIEAADQCVQDVIEVACEKYHVATDRIFLAGYQCGGTMAIRLGLRHPERFAGVMSVGGPFPTGEAPLSRLREIRRLPILIAQGREAEHYSLDVACDELRLFHSAGLHVTLRQYPCGDELTTKMLLDLNEWIMERINGEPECVASDAVA